MLVPDAAANVPEAALGVDAPAVLADVVRGALVLVHAEGAVGRVGEAYSEKILILLLLCSYLSF